MFAQPLVDTKAPPRRPRYGAPVATAEFFGREATVMTLALTGLDCHLVHVTARLEQGSAAFEIAGLPEASMRETRVRVRAGLQTVGAELPPERLTVRFDHPQFIRGGSADTAIAIAVLAVLGRIDPAKLKGIAIVGELALTSQVRSVRGILPMLLGAARLGVLHAIIPGENGMEAAHATGIRVSLTVHLAELVRHFREGVPLDSPEPPPPGAAPEPGPDLADIRGLSGPRRALEIAAAGGHGLLMTGSPGSGRTMLARRLPGLLPEMTEEEALAVTSIYSIAGLTSRERGFVAQRPFRAPHHTVSAAGVLGGGDPVRPGEVTLAHGGVLFLDDALEFRSSVLESLALVLWDGHATIMRAGIRTRFPAGALTVSATGPCPCGYLGSAAGRCTCPPEAIARHRNRLRLPLFETLDVRVTLPATDVAAVHQTPRGEPSKAVRERVVLARAAAALRAKTTGAASLNAALTHDDLERVATPDAAGARVLTGATEQLALTDPQVRRVLRVARTIADLDGSDAVRAPHVSEAVALTITDDARLTLPRATGGEHAA